MSGETSTKEKIMEVALDLFSQKGLDAVGVEEIARAVGIKAPSLYKHYKNKQAIFDAIMDEMERRYQIETERMYRHLYSIDSAERFMQDVTLDEIIEGERRMVLYLMHDEYISKFRKLLTIEQFREKRFADLYNTRHINFLVTYYKRVFFKLKDLEIIKGEDPYIMAIHYVSPIIELLTYNDRKPEQEETTLELIERHIRQFVRVYKNV